MWGFTVNWILQSRYHIKCKREQHHIYSGPWDSRAKKFWGFFWLIFLGSTFLESVFFSKVRGLLRLYCPLPPKRGGPCTYYILVHLEQKELFPSMQIICQDSSTVFWQSQRQIFARYTHTNTLYLSLYTQTIHIVFVICILVRKKGERLKEASPNLSF